jgi:hypothetical protein
MIGDDAVGHGVGAVLGGAEHAALLTVPGRYWKSLRTSAAPVAKCLALAVIAFAEIQHLPRDHRLSVDQSLR